jgi:hypothetical protein
MTAAGRLWFGESCTSIKTTDCTEMGRARGLKHTDGFTTLLTVPQSGSMVRAAQRLAASQPAELIESKDGKQVAEVVR